MIRSQVYKNLNKIPECNHVLYEGTDTGIIYLKTSRGSLVMVNKGSWNCNLAIGKEFDENDFGDNPNVIPFYGQVVIEEY